MKLKIVTSIVLGLILGVLCDDAPASASEQKDNSDKRFSSDSGKFTSFNDQNKGLVDWSKAFHKRFSGKKPSSFTSEGMDEKLVDWSKMFKRFGTDNSGQFGQNNDNFVQWNDAFSKRFQGGKNGFLDNDGKIVDWSSMFKRFGTEAENPEFVDWSAAFQKNKRSKRSTSGFKRFRAGDMSFMPETLKSGDFIDWSRVFAKRGFDGYDNTFGGPSSAYTMQDWRNLMAKRNFGSQSMGYFGHDGLTDHNLQNWNSLLERKRRATREDEINQ